MITAGNNAGQERSFRYGAALVLCAIAAFHLAYGFTPVSFLIVVFLYCLARLAEMRSPRAAFYFGLAAGLGAYVPQSWFFTNIFGPAAVALWIVLAFWLGLFAALAQQCQRHFGRVIAALLRPLLWTGTEYFRSELYYLRFSWLNVGYAFADVPQFVPFPRLGIYGVGFVGMAIAVAFWRLPTKARVLTGLFLVGVLTLYRLSPALDSPFLGKSQSIHVAGVQLEFPSPKEVPPILDKLIQRYPEAVLIVLSEYTFDGPVPDGIRAWCRQNRRFLIAGGKDVLSETEFYNTAFVIGPNGEEVFRQVKSVPIQFFKDGLPAPEQKVWHSPWGKLGLCVCYDLSYTRVVDRFIRLEAQAIIAPTMDVSDWGEAQHKLHARVAPVRAAEYGVPIFRVCSSGISQLVDRRGCVTATAPFPGEGVMIAGKMTLGKPGQVPLDRFLALFSAGATLALLLWFSGKACWRPRSQSKPDSIIPTP